MNWFKSFVNKDITQSEDAVEPVTVVWIHGANQTHQSFEYLRTYCSFQKEYLINYSSSNRFYQNLNRIVDEVKDIGPVFVVGHSLGGLYALHLTNHVNIVGGVSISTPFKGSSTADWAKYVVPSYPLFRDIGRNSPPVADATKIKLEIPWTQVISTSGSVPYHGGVNDGVVTIESMNGRDDMIKIELPYTHYEIVCNSQVGDILVDEYQKIIAPSRSATNI